MKMGCSEKAAAKEDPDDDSIVFLDSIEEHEKECNHRVLVLSGETKPFIEYLNMLKEWQKCLLESNFKLTDDVLYILDKIHQKSGQIFRGAGL